MRLRTFVRITRWIARLHIYINNRLFDRLFKGKAVGVWEIPNADMEISAEFMRLLALLRNPVDPRSSALQQMLVFHRPDEQPAIYIVGTFDPAQWVATQAHLNQVPGIERIFTVEPTALVNAAMHGGLFMHVTY